MQRKWAACFAADKKLRYRHTTNISFSYICIMEAKENKTTGSLFRRFANKYTFVGLLFAVWIIFFDQYSLVEKTKLQAKISTLENEKDYYRQKLEEDTRKKEELMSSRDNLEKFAREQYLMKNENEEIFVIVK